MRSRLLFSQGILHARGALILFADADGATRFSDLSPLCAEMDRVRTPTGHGAVVGSRAHLVGSEAVVKVRVDDAGSALVDGMDEWLSQWEGSRRCSLERELPSGLALPTCSFTYPGLD